MTCPIAVGIYQAEASAGVRHGVVAGTVLDSSGAPIAGAQVALKVGAGAGSTRVSSTRTASTRAASVRTGGSGEFRLPAVDGVTYQVEVDAPGFAHFTGQVVGGGAAMGVRLEVGGATEQVEVSGDGSAQVDPQSTEMGTTLAATQVASVPLNGRSFTDLLAITPGVVPVSSAQPNAVVMSGVASTPPSGDLDVGALSVSGQRETANAFRVNGADVQEDVNMGVAIVPTLDSIAELKVLTGDFDARLGNQSGGQIQVTTRSGGDQLHGSVYDYLRNTALDARSYFSLTRAAFRQNQFGGTVGGPTRLRRLHFFADYQGTRQTQDVDTGVIAVPSTLNRTGDFSSGLSALSGTVTGAGWAQRLSERLGYAVESGEAYAKAGCASTNAATGCVFPGGVIPKRAWSAPAKALLADIPQPNLGPSSFSSAEFAEQLRDDKGALRGDVSLGIGELALYGFVDDYSLLNPYPTSQGGASVPGSSAKNDGRAQLYSANLTTALGAAAVNQAHASYMRNAAVVGQPVGGLGASLSSQGFVTGADTSGIVALAPAQIGTENVVFNSFTLGTPVTNLAQAENIFEGSDDVTRSAGKHLLSAGVTFHADQVNTQPDEFDNGSFSFTGSETGVDFADFLIGIDSSYTQGEGQKFYNRNHYLGLYGQDSWRVRPTLTLNYGLRWDVLPPWYEKYNQLLSLDPGEQSVVFPNAPQGVVFPGDAHVPRTISPTRYTDVAPRVAASWAPARWKDRLVVRAGYGVYYSAFEGLSAGIMSGNPPYGFTDTLPAPTLFDQPFVVASTGQSLGQRFPLQQVPFGASASRPVSTVDWANYEPLTGIAAFANNNVTPYTENYRVALEGAIGAHTTAQIAYVGTQAHHLLVVEEVNPGDPALCLRLSEPAQVATGSPTCGPFNESSMFTAANGTVYLGTRPAFSGAFGSVNLQKTIANAHDNALEASVQHATKSLFVQLAYTWSQSMDDSSSLAEAVYPGDAGRSRALSAFDMRHNFSAAYRWSLPVGRVWRSRPRVSAGWELSGLTRLGTGLPVTLVNNQDTSLLGTAPNGINNNGIDEPEFTPGRLALRHRPGGAAFDTSLFSLPALGVAGNARRRFFAGPGLDNTDLALSKVTRLREGTSLELRLESFNLFNHAQFFGPSAVQGNISAANFGAIQTAAPPRLMQVAARLTF